MERDDGEKTKIARPKVILIVSTKQAKCETVIIDDDVCKKVATCITE
jgi:hypothetical protein